MSYYYLDAENRPNGPLPIEDIRRKAAAGEIPANPMVAAVGTAEWKPLGPGAGGAPAVGAGFDHWLSQAAAGVLAQSRATLTPGFLEASLQFARRFGHLLVVVGGVLGIAYAIYFLVQNSAWIGFVALALFVVALAGAHLAARRFLTANETLLSPSRLASPALADCLALLALFLATATLVSGVLVCIRATVWQPLIPTLIGSALWVYVATLALHPSVLNVEHAPQTGGEETIGIVVFSMKAALKMVPFVFLAMVALGTVAIVLKFFGADDAATELASRNALPLPRALRGADGIGGMKGLTMIISGCLVPLFAYVLFIACSLPIDLWRAVLALPAKIDALRK